MEPLAYNSGDQVEINSGNFYMGAGTITSFSNSDNAKIANVEMFDGTFYSVPLNELTRLSED